MKRALSDKLIVTHLLAFIAGLGVAYFAMPALRDNPWLTINKPEETVRRLPPVVAEIRAVGSPRVNVPYRTPTPDQLGGRLIIPVQGIARDQLLDTFTQSRSESRVHNAIDIMAPEGTPVLAAVDGRIEKLHDSAAGGITIYQFNAQRNYSFYYAHLSAYAPNLAEGQLVHKGDLIGYVGHTGNASPDGPHLHFAVHALPPNARWSDGEAINPYPILRGE